MAGSVRSRPHFGIVPWSAVIFAGLWIWAIWSCAEYWRGNPNYSYGWAVPLLALGFAWRRYFELPSTGGRPSRAGFMLWWPMVSLLALALGATVFALEFARQQMWHSQFTLVTICFLAIAFSLALFWTRGGPALFRAELFPVLFFLTAIPWPPRLEQPVTSGLM